ncbi:hypothetical protein ACH5RR_029644 [Cinchona calisaya]|uniref:F5/8 type C domain-containing protein n=1 Tax=Cinchona calisaya TaxID=153742 RepID=A0ABD2YXH4_9GENT
MIDFNGPRDDKIGTYTVSGDVRRALCFDISDRDWYQFVREDTTFRLDGDRYILVLRLSMLTTRFLNISNSELAVFRRSNNDSDFPLRELYDPSVPEVWYQFLTSRILPITHLTKVTQDRVVLLYALVKCSSIDIDLEIQMHSL